MKSTLTPIREKSHPDEFPILSCLGSAPVLITTVSFAKEYLRRMDETRQRLETAIRIAEQRKGGEA